MLNKFFRSCSRYWWPRKPRTIRRPARNGGRLQCEMLEDRLIPSATKMFAGLEFMTTGAFATNNHAVTSSDPVQVGVAPAKNATFTPVLQLDGGVSFSDNDPSGAFSTNGTVSGIADKTLLLLDAHMHNFTAPGLLNGFYSLPVADLNLAHLSVGGGSLVDTALHITATELDLQGTLNEALLKGVTIPVTGQSHVALTNIGVSVTGPDPTVAGPEVFTKAGLTVTLQNLDVHSDQANGASDISGQASFTIGGNTLNVTLGSTASPGLVFANGDLQSLNATVTPPKGNTSTPFVYHGLSFALNSASFSYEKAASSFGIGGDATLSIKDQTFNIKLGTPDVPGIQIQRGALTSIDASLTSDIKVGGVMFHTENLGLHYSVSDPTNSNVEVTGEASFQFKNQTIEVALGFTDSANVSHPGIAIDPNGGQLVTLDAAISTDIKIGSVELKAKDLGVHYGVNDPYITITGSASFDFKDSKAADAGDQDQTVEIMLGDTSGGTAHPGITINKTDGSLVALDAAITTDLKVAGLAIKTDGLGVHYTSLGGQFDIYGSASFELQDNSITLGLGTATAPGLMLDSGGNLLNLHTSISAHVSLLGITLDADNLTVDYMAPANGNAEMIAISGDVSVTTKFVTFSSNLGTEDSPGLMLLGGSLQKLDITINGGFSLFGMSLAAEDLHIIYMKDAGSLEISGGAMLELGSAIKANVQLAEGGLLIDLNTGALTVDYHNGLEIKADLELSKFFAVKGLDIYFKQEPDGNVDFSAKGEVDFPGGYQIGLTALDIKDGQLTDIGLHLAGHVELGETGVFVDELDGALHNLNDPSNITVDASATLSIGPEITIPDIPGIVKGGNYAIVLATGSIHISPTDLMLSGSVQLAGGLLGDGQATVDLNWGTGIYKVSVDHLGIYDDTINFSGDLIISAQGDVTLQAMASVNVPAVLPIIGGTELGEANIYLQIRPEFGFDSTGLTHDFFAAWTSVNLIFTSYQIGFKVDFNGDINVIHGDDIQNLADCVPNPPDNNHSTYVYSTSVTLLEPTAANYEFTANSPIFDNVLYPSHAVSETLTAPTPLYIGDVATGRYVTEYSLTQPNDVLQTLAFSITEHGVVIGVGSFDNNGNFTFTDYGNAPYLPRPTGATVTPGGLVTISWTGNPSAPDYYQGPSVPTSIAATYQAADAYFAVTTPGPNGPVTVGTFSIDPSSSGIVPARTDGTAGDRVFDIPAGPVAGSYNSGLYTVELISNSAIADANQPSFTDSIRFLPPTVSFAQGSPYISKSGQLVGYINADSFSPSARQTDGTGTTVSIYCSASNSTSNGTLLQTLPYSQFQDNAPGYPFALKTSGFNLANYQNLPPGQYYFYAVIDDTQNPPVYSAVSGPITVLDPKPMLSGPVGVPLTVTNGTASGVFSAAAGTAFVVGDNLNIPVNVDITATGGTVMLAGGTAAAEITQQYADAALATEALDKLTFTADSSTATAGTVTFTVTATINGVDHQSIQTIPVVASNTHLVVTQSVDAMSPSDPDTVIVTVSATNPGGFNAQNGTNVQIQEYVTPGVSVETAVASPGTSYDMTSGQWTIGNLPIGAPAATLTLTLKAKPGTANTRLTAMADGGSTPPSYPAAESESVVAILPRSHALALTQTTLPTGAVRSGYFVPLQADSGGGGPYTYQVSSGTLPAGMFLDQSGDLTGLPTIPGTYYFSVTATSPQGSSATQAYTLTIASAKVAVVGQFYVTSVGDPLGYGGGSVYSIATGALPPGLQLSGSTILGTPTTPGYYGVVVTESFGIVATQIGITIIVEPSIQVGPARMPMAIAGMPYSQQITATGGSVAGFSFAIVNGSLPAGLSLNYATGVISGTIDPAAAGAYNFVLTAFDGAGASQSHGYTILVESPIQVAELPTATVNSPYSTTLQATGGSGSGYQFALVGGTLPAGLSLSAAGVLSGTIPAGTVAASAVLTIATTDSAGVEATQSLTLNVNQAIVITTTDLPDGDAGSNYMTTLAVTGGTGSGYALALTGGKLPAGLQLSASGVLSGTIDPAAHGGYYGFTVTATDSSGATGSAPCALFVDGGVVMPTPQLPDATVAAPFMQTLRAFGGSGKYTFAVTGGKLPGGLTLSPGGVLGGVIPTSTPIGSYSFVVTVTDSQGNMCTSNAVIRVDPAILMWTGGVSSAWSNPANWSVQVVPGAGTNVYIPSSMVGGRMPVLDVSAVVANLVLQPGTSLMLAGHGLTDQGIIINKGTLVLQGNELVNLAHGNDTTEGTWQYVGDGNGSILTLADFGARDYFNLAISDTHLRRSTFKTMADLMVNGMLIVTGGTLKPAGTVTTGGVIIGGTGLVYAPAVLNDYGNWFAVAGAFIANQGTVNLLGMNEMIFGSTTFFNLSKTTTLSDTLTFQAGSTQTIAGMLTLKGAAGKPLALRSTAAGSVWRISAHGTTVAFVNVKDSADVGSQAITASSSVNGGNVSRWRFV
jgi:hypothetical protein